jgi:glycolate oxidase
VARSALTTSGARLASLLPADIVVTDPDVIAFYARDRSRFTIHGWPVAVLMPRTTDEVSRCMRAASELRVPVVPRGAGTGLSGGANAATGSVVLSLHRMNRILEIDPVDRIAVVEPGVITAALRDAAAAVGMSYPPDPGSVDMCTVGGNVATNAGGMCCVKYGVTADFVIGLEVVLADGRVMRTGRRTVKGVAGYDLTHLLVGSEGTLGVVTEITVRLVPAAPAPHTVVASFARLADAGAAVLEIRRAGLVPSLMEILDRTTLGAVDQLAQMRLGDEVAALLLIQGDGADAADLAAAADEICTRSGAVDVASSSDPDEATMLLEARRLALPALERLGHCLLDDVAVPPSRTVDLIAAVEEISARLGVVIGVFGHAGDGNMHPTIIFDDADPRSRTAALAAFDAVTQKALDLGGTITGEHGVGQLKRGWLSRELDPTARAVHVAVKAALDPQGILNPDTAIPER